jgi:diguanylate cyclase (GGDEF)-like protein
MSRNQFGPKFPPLLAFVFLLLHAGSMFLFRSHSLIATYPFLILAPFCALLACIWRVRTVNPPERLPWILLSIGIFLWTSGMSLSAWADLVQAIPFSIAFYSDLLYFLYGVPLLLAISSSSEEERIPLLIWLDSIQALLTAYLAYITLFEVAPFTTTTIHPVSVSLLPLTYNLENLILATAASLVLVARPRANQRFFQILCLFLWSYAICAGIYNYNAIATNGHTTSDLLIDIPFLWLTVTVLALPEKVKSVIELERPRKPLALFVENGSPIFYTLALSALGVTIVREHFLIGIIAILAAGAVYGVRSITLQTRYAQSQRALREASRHLEELSLKDGLTNVANRRCFDQVLDAEWTRLTRAQDSLSLLLIDIDHFKNLNDKYGHRYGDHCLVMIACTLQSVLTRTNDIVARYGGEEFAIILPATDRNGAEVVAEKILIAVRDLNLTNETAIGNIVTVSIGVAVCENPLTVLSSDLLEASDRALYMAKEKGRNRVEYSSMYGIYAESQTEPHP